MSTKMEIDDAIQEIVKTTGCELPMAQIAMEFFLDRRTLVQPWEAMGAQGVVSDARSNEDLTEECYIFHQKKLGLPIAEVPFFNDSIRGYKALPEKEQKKWENVSISTYNLMREIDLQDTPLHRMKTYARHPVSTAGLTAALCVAAPIAIVGKIAETVVPPLVDFMHRKETRQKEIAKQERNNESNAWMNRIDGGWSPEDAKNPSGKSLSEIRSNLVVSAKVEVATEKASPTKKTVPGHK